jgi:small subunit ribosomal protein S5
VVECAGIHNILTKSIGSNNPINLAKAAAEGLQQLRARETVFELRGVN